MTNSTATTTTTTSAFVAELLAMRADFAEAVIASHKDGQAVRLAVWAGEVELPRADSWKEENTHGEVICTFPWVLKGQASKRCLPELEIKLQKNLYGDEGKSHAIFLRLLGGGNLHPFHLRGTAAEVIAFAVEKAEELTRALLPLAEVLNQK